MVATDTPKRPWWVVRTTPRLAVVVGTMFAVLAIAWGTVFAPADAGWEWLLVLFWSASAVQHLMTWRWLRAHPEAVVPRKGRWDHP